MAPSMPTGLIDPSFCCCAVPLVNAGIYAIIAEQAVLGVAVGVSALVTPNAVGTFFPTFAKVIFAIVCLVVTIIQPVGFIGVLREKTSTFKIYALINAVVIACAFIASAALIATSAAKHEDAVLACQRNFFSTNNSTSSGIGSSQIQNAQNSTLSDEGQALCSPFAWADIGIMGGLWVILLLTQLYFIYYTYSYSKTQVKDHKLYHSVYSENPEAFTMSILRSTRYNPGSVYSQNPMAGIHDPDAWDARGSMDSPGQRGYYDNSQEQLAEQPQYDQSVDQYGNPIQGGYEGYPPQAGPSGHPGMYADPGHQEQATQFPNPYPNTAGQGYGDHESTGGGYQDQYGSQGYAGGQPGGGYEYSQQHGGAPPYVHEPEDAMSRDPGQTPTLNRYSQGQGVGFAGNSPGLARPEQAQGHPAEGLFGRKSPRMG